MKSKNLFSLIMTFVFIFTSAFSIETLAVNAGNNISDIEEKKIYSQATLSDDFSDSRVMVVMNHSASMELNEFQVDDFSEIKVQSVVDLSSATREKATMQLEKLNYAFFNRLPVETENFESYEYYNQVVCLELEECGKDKVLEAIEILQQREDVICVEPDYPIFLCSSDNDDENTEPDEQCYIEYRAMYDELIQLPEAWEISTGASSVVVGVIDSGIDGTHPDLVGKINVSMSRDLSNGAYEYYEYIDEVIDETGHGTHVAGIIGAGMCDEEVSVRGVCWNVTLASLRIFNDQGVGYSSYLYMAINCAEAENIPILNFSGSWRSYHSNWSTFDCNALLYSMIRNYSGLLVCTASNNGSNNDNHEVYPANWSLPNLITVGASNLNDQRDPGSNYSKTKVDIFAPGKDIYSTYISPHEYASLTGTSHAAPYVTGVAALMLANNPDLEPYEIKCIIMRNVDDCGTAFDEECVSGGRLNAYKALTGTVNHSYTFVDDGTSDSLVCDYCKYSHESLTYISISVISGHRVTCFDCGYSFTQAHEWINRAGTYCCLKCGATSAFIPVPGVLSLEITDMIEGKGLVGDFAMAIDEETMLCRVGEDYYYVKADSEAEALALLNAELAVVKPEVQME